MSFTKMTMYCGREGSDSFRPMTREEVEGLVSGQHVWFRSIVGNDARRIKINGRVRTWAKDRERIEVPVKYGMYDYATFYAHNIDRLLVRRESKIPALKEMLGV